MDVPTVTNRIQDTRKTSFEGVEGGTIVAESMNTRERKKQRVMRDNACIGRERGGSGTIIVQVLIKNLGIQRNACENTCNMTLLAMIPSYVKSS